jgi:hypothetical protein
VTQNTAESSQRDQTAGDTAVYVYGVVPAEISVDEAEKGVGDPPHTVETVSSGSVAALVGDIQIGKPLGTPDDLAAHARVLDSVAAEHPVLPLRFGAVVSDRESVVQELLEPNVDTFESSLRELDGSAQYVLRGRYVEDALLRELLDEDPGTARLYADIRGEPDEVAHDARIAFGERIAQGVQNKREADTRDVAAIFDDLQLQAVMREPATEWDAVSVACLVPADRKKELDDAVQSFAGDHEGRIEVRLLGPMAAYDFVAVPQADQRG